MAAGQRTSSTRKALSMEYQAINLKRKLEQFSDHWAPKVVSQVNNYHVKLAKIEGEFIWHSHPDTDELFLVLSGELEILFRDGKVALGPGELFVVPRGMEHKPVANEECQIMLMEPAGTANTGEVVDALTALTDVWI